MSQRLLYWLALLVWTLTTAAVALADGPRVKPGNSRAEWQTISLAGATCGTGAPYQYFLNPADEPDQPLLVYFEGGSACYKEGRAPSGSSDAVRQSYCMAYDNFGQPQPTLLSYYGLFQRGLSDNNFRNANFAFVPYCTGDLHTGTATEAHDYNPDPGATFNVTHRGHLNALAALKDLATRFPNTTRVILIGSSAGAVGALYNFPDVIRRWPDTILVTDAGTLPNVSNSTIRRAMLRNDLPWQPRSLLPPYCNTDDCLVDTTRLMIAHADHYNGDAASWRAFGLVQGERDQTLANAMEITTCAYQFGLRQALDGVLPPNLRAFAPATTMHTFLALSPQVPLPGYGNYRYTIDGVSVMDWVTQMINAQTVPALPTTRVEQWPLCPGLHLPLLRLMLP
ncbi:MAG: pectinacetylesterase family protein [Ardenticatenaceae bacterium]|nr:pectinacetylesterase family protein [Ardenticatenaceae bacterium]